MNPMRFFLLSLVLFGANAASAGEAPVSGSAPMPPVGWQKDFGVGLILNPEYQGGEDYRLLPIPYFDFRLIDDKGVKAFVNVPQGVGRYMVRERLQDGSRFALSAALAPGFQNRDTDEFEGLDTFGVGLEARIGADYDNGPWSLQANVAKAVVSGHEGLYGNLSASYRFVVGRGAFASVGPNLRYGDDRYMSALYGVTERESVASGLRAFRAGSGLESVALQGVISLPVGDKWRFTGVTRLGRLVGEAGDSSLTAQPNQLFIVTALTRSF